MNPTLNLNVLMLGLQPATGEDRDVGSRGEGQGTGYSGRGEETRGGAAGAGPEETVYDVAAADDVDQGQPRDRRWQRVGGILHTECWLHGHRREEEEQEAGRVLDHH